MTDAFERPDTPQPGGIGDEEQIRDFLSGVVPWPSADEEGFITIHWKYPGREGFHGKPCRTVEEALAQVIRLRGKGCDIYFGLFRTRLSDGTRDRANAIVTSSLFADADVDPDNPKAFASFPEALASIFAFCIELKIPKPSLIVFSGGGFHVYWLSDKTLPVEDWQPFADALMNAIRRAGLKIKDVGVTGDAARVLRVPDTINWKQEGNPRPVRLLSKYCTGMRHDFAVVFAELLKIAPAGPAARKRPSFNHLGPVPEAFRHLKIRSLGAGIETLSSVSFPPVKEGCAWLREAHDTGGKDFDNPQWNLTNLCAVFLENGHELAHEFGDQHPDYVFEKTEKEWDRKNREHDIKGINWPSCKAIQNAGSKHCEACPHFAAGKSPLNLGLRQDPKEEETEETEEMEGTGDDGDGGVTLVPGTKVKFRDLDHHKKPKASLANAVIAIRALDITARQDLFRNRIIVTYKGDAKTIREGLLTDDTISAVRSLVNNTYRIDCGDSITFTAIREVARDNASDPILDMLDDFQAKWDGKKRLDTWVIDYMGCEDTPLNRAIGRLTLIAACRRARVPGCKYDNITNLEGPEGLNKSTLIRTLAGDDYFSDESIIGASSKEVQEQLDGKWMHENADLAGIVKRDVDKVNAFASRQVDRARPAYGRVNEDRPRRSIEWGTINQDVYLLRQTGNRRWWPLKTTKIDIEAVIRDRAQLLGEAATYEADGASIVLEEKLWGDATKAQEQRRIPDPWEDILADMPSKVIHKSDDGFERVASADVLLNVLLILAERQTSGHGQRLSHVMRHLGWERNESGLVTINGHIRRGYRRRSPPPRTKAELEAIKAEAEASAGAKARDLFEAMETDVQAEAWTAAKVEQLLNATETHAEIQAKKADPTDWAPTAKIPPGRPD